MTNLFIGNKQIYRILFIANKQICLILFIQLSHAQSIDGCGRIALVWIGGERHGLRPSRHGVCLTPRSPGTAIAVPVHRGVNEKQPLRGNTHVTGSRLYSVCRIGSDL